MALKKLASFACIADNCASSIRPPHQNPGLCPSGKPLESKPMIQSALNSLDPERRTVLLQLIRYALAGLAITLAAAASYWAIADLLHVDPMLSYTIVFIIFSGISYVTHGEFSFKGHGERDRHHIRMGRFFAIMCSDSWSTRASLAARQALDGPTWWPTIPMVLVTPLLTFVLHRRFVYA